MRTAKGGSRDKYVTVTEAKALAESPHTMARITAGTARATLHTDARIWAHMRNGEDGCLLVNRLCLGEKVWTTGNSTQSLDSLIMVTGEENLIALKFYPDWAVEAYEPVANTLMVKGTKHSTRRGALRPNSGNLNPAHPAYITTQMTICSRCSKVLHTTCTS